MKTLRIILIVSTLYSIASISILTLIVNQETTVKTDQNISYITPSDQSKIQSSGTASSNFKSKQPQSDSSSSFSSESSLISSSSASISKNTIESYSNPFLPDFGLAYDSAIWNFSTDTKPFLYGGLIERDIILSSKNDYTIKVTTTPKYGTGCFFPPQEYNHERLSNGMFAIDFEGKLVYSTVIDPTCPLAQIITSSIKSTDIPDYNDSFGDSDTFVQFFYDINVYKTSTGASISPLDPMRKEMDKVIENSSFPQLPIL